MGARALESLDAYAPKVDDFAEIFGIDVALASTVREAVARKLAAQPVEDYRIDFEDGYGWRSDSEEDQHAQQAAHALAEANSRNTLPENIGIRIKPLTEHSSARALRTLTIFLTELAAATSGSWSKELLITLPKITQPSECARLADALAELETRLHLPQGSLRIEIMVETPEILMDDEGRCPLRKFAQACQGRCFAAHLGAYDLLSSFGISAHDQTLTHAICDRTRHTMQLALAGAGVHLVDGATNLLPIPPVRAAALSPDQQRQNRESVHAAWRLHFDNVRHALQHGFFQGWDLHPAQLGSRYAAVYSHVWEALPAASNRLKNFLDQAAKATALGSQFDDAATAMGLLNYFRWASDCGAISDSEMQQASGLSVSELEEPFEVIIRQRERVT